MYKKIIVLLLVIMTTGVYAQNSRGKSKAGNITNPFKKYTEIRSGTGLVCEVTYKDESGDKILSKGEVGKIIVVVKNNGNSTVHSPKLEIEYKASWNTSPKSIVKWMDPIISGGTGEYTSKIIWDKRLPAGSITYTTKVVDSESGFESETVDIAFNIAGGETEAVEPVFVDVDINIPKVGRSNRNGIAVIIGNEKYTHKDVPNVQYAKNDARTVKKYVMDMLGFREENIIYIEDADKSDFERVFGTDQVVEGKLYNYVRANISEVFIYYSGHGAPDVSNRKAYFMPSNSDPNYVKIDGYSLQVFYENLNKIPAKSITVVLDACFSGGSQKGMILKKASPMYIDVKYPLYSNKIDLITSATGAQISSWYPKANHSLFTYYFLRALRGEADKNQNRDITLNEINLYLNDNIPYMARRLYGREQTPTIKGNADRVICSYK